MPAVAAKPAARKQPRTLSFVPNTDEASPIAGLLTIADGKGLVKYVVTEFPTGFPGRGFHLGKIGGGEGYSVFCSHRGSAGDSCECMGSTHHGHCKHRDAVRKLVELNRI